MKIGETPIEFTWLPETEFLVMWDGRPIDDKERSQKTWWVRFNADGSWESMRGFWKEVPYRTRGKRTMRWMQP